MAFLEKTIFFLAKITFFNPIDFMIPSYKTVSFYPKFLNNSEISFHFEISYTLITLYFIHYVKHLQERNWIINDGHNSEGHISHFFLKNLVPWTHGYLH